MFRLSPQRNPRSKGFKVKYALQICVLLGVCIWLVYQVQNSREKKASYGENTKTVKLGRKDPHPSVEQPSVIDARPKEKEDEINGMEDEILTQKNEKNNNDKNSEYRQDPVDQETEESSENAATKKESEENDNKANKESDGVKKDDEENKNEVEDDKSREIKEDKTEPEKEEARETDTDNKENEEINKNRIGVKERMEGNQEQDEEESNETENERQESGKIQEVVLSKDQVEDKEKNNEEPREEQYAADNASSAVGFNKTEQSDKTENNEFELESQTNSTEVAHLDQNKSVSNVTESKTTEVTNYAVTTTKQGDGTETQAEEGNDSQKSSIADSDDQEHNKPLSVGLETLHSLNGTNTTSNTTEKQFETSENSKVDDSSLHNTMLEVKDSNSDSASQQADSTLINSSRLHESNVTNGKYNYTFGNSAQIKHASNNSIQGVPENVLSPNSNENSTNSEQNDSVTSGQSNTNSDGSVNDNTGVSQVNSENNDDARQVEKENTFTGKNEDGAQNESVESQKEEEESGH